MPLWSSTRCLCSASSWIRLLGLGTDEGDVYCKSAWSAFWTLTSHHGILERGQSWRDAEIIVKITLWGGPASSTHRTSICPVSDQEHEASHRKPLLLHHGVFTNSSLMVQWVKIQTYLPQLHKTTRVAIQRSLTEDRHLHGQHQRTCDRGVTDWASSYA